MKSKFFILLFATIIFYLSALEVDIDEIKNVNKIQFENYKGHIDKYDSERSIRNIGYQLGLFEKENELFRYHMKYSIIHAIDEKTKEKYDADIFSIDSDAQVGHIRNIRFIISGYLSKQYGYTKRQSDALALFLTYYNAYYRGNLEYFNDKYKEIVINYINKSNAGISTKYYEWPGSTKILIPLTKSSQKDKLKSLETFEISNSKIIDEMRKSDDKKIDERKEMVKLKEKELVEEKKSIEKEKKDVQTERKEIEKQKDTIEKEKEEIAKKEDEIKKEKEEVKNIKDDKSRKNKEEEIKKEEKKLEEKKAEVIKKEEAVKKEETKVSKKEEQVKQKEQTALTKTQTVQKEKEQIKRDITQPKSREEALAQKEKELKEREDELKRQQRDDKVYADKFYYLKTKEYMVGGHYNNEMYIIDAAGMKVSLKSPVEKICGYKYLVYKEGVVVITYKTTHESDHNLTLLDLEKLDVKKAGIDNIFFRSFIEEYENHIFAIVKNGDDYYLGKFNKSLERVAISDEKIDFATFITFYKDYIYVNNVKNEIIVLNKNDLKNIGIVKP
ncbi:MAG: hypothetical protein JXB50_02125 [Spirochaetes bacterium]|nr:hypothetical protein [Spirochaetota bacterium]